MTIDFYYTPLSGPCRAVLLTAKKLGIDLNLKHISLKDGEHLKPEFVKINPQHCVPTLVDDGFAIWESRAIITYLVDKYAKDDSLYPKDPKKRAVVLHRLFFDATVVYQRFAEAYYPLLFEGSSVPEDKAKRLEEGLDFLNTFLADGDYVAGNTLTVADISLAATITSLEVCDVNVTKHVNIAKWLNKIKSTLNGFDETNKGVEDFRQMYLAAAKK